MENNLKGIFDNLTKQLERIEGEDYDAEADDASIEEAEKMMK